MAPPRKRRFLREDNLEAKKAREEKVIEEYSQKPLDDSPDIAETTEQCRERLMMEWTDYWRSVLEIDPDSIWLDLCLNSDLATSRCRAFLRGYVEDSVQEIPTLGPEETVKKRTITSANSLLQVWRGLIARADATVLKHKRREDPSKKDTWTLKFMDHSNRQGRGPVFEISRWIFGAGAKELGLCTELMVEKIEAAAEDVIGIANIVWERPDVIPCTPIIRVAFLALLVLAGIGGFRPKAILGFKFNQVLLAIVRDQKDRSRTKIAVTFRIPIVKTRRSSKGTKAKWITFTVFFVPVPSICLGSFVTSLAIAADAFEPSVDSVQTLLQRPNLEGTDYLPLKWKKEVEDAPIFPLDYATFRSIWLQACLAFGLRNSPRLYTLRVGAGMDLDGVLSDVLRNYVMSNTSSVFQKSYQAEHIRVNLLRLKFEHLYPDEAWDDGLEQAMRTMSLKRDPDAPILPSEEDLQSFELRKDIFTLRDELAKSQAACLPRQTWNSIYMRLRNLLRNLSDQVVKLRREEYFERVDRSRALGHSTSGEAATATVPRAKHARLCYGGEALDEVARFVQRYRCSSDEREKVEPYCQKRYLEVLVGYLTNQPAVAKPEDGEGEVIALDLTSTTSPSQDENKHMCLLCKQSFFSRGSLTNHCKELHVKKGTFGRPFPCPECRRKHEPDYLITSPSSWSSHVERTHGKEHAPILRTDPHPILDVKKVCCPFCGLYLSTKGFGMHIKGHVPDRAASVIFSTPFPCQSCCHEQGNKKPGVIIDGCSAWNKHVSLAHSEVARTWSIGISLKDKKEHICFLCERSLSRREYLTTHCKTMHIEIFDQPFPCPECRRKRQPDYLITSPSSWSSHVEGTHGKEHAPILRTDPTSDETEPRCPFCGLFFQQKGFYSHFRSHVRAGSTIFSTPFPCLLCAHSKQSGDEKQSAMIDGCSAWDAHVFSSHSENSRIWTVGTPPVGRKRRREVEDGTSITEISCLLCNGSFPLRGIRTHFMKKHLPISSESTSCFSCSGRYQGDQEPKSRVYISGSTAWNEHVGSNHGEVSRYFTTSGFSVTQSSFTASDSLPGTPTSIIRRKRRRTEATVATPEKSSTSPTSPISLMSEGWEIPEECGYDINNDPQTPPSSQQSLIDLSMIDPILLEMDRSTSASHDEPHTPASSQECDIDVFATAVTPWECSESTMSLINGDGEGRGKSGDSISNNIQTPPSSEQSSIDLSMTDLILLETDDRSIPTPRDDPHTPASPQESDLHVIAPVLLDEEGKPGHMESTVTQPRCDSQGKWQAEAILAKWKRGKTTRYLVKWKGFPHEHNTWEPPKNLNLEFIKVFEATYNGNHLGVQLLEKRERGKRVEYLVQWMGRPERDNSWEREATISHERIMEFEDWIIV